MTSTLSTDGAADVFGFQRDDLDPHIFNCVFTTESVVGPFWASDQELRWNIIDGQPGVPMNFKTQVVDITNCTLASWSILTQMGAYSDTDTGGQGGLSTRYLRDALYLILSHDFPGHSYSRATHVHVMVKSPRFTITNDNHESRGCSILARMICFDEASRGAVERKDVYKANTRLLGTNNEDGFALDQAINA
ncbi:hypothetical protein K432DRAFT_397178 [Lepidopterella palustris CBS 459.81]|uniref:Aromatic compound dioxygenase n=1 Tax=Lepidopterella palustris CBS 459.81 TaxID=1314670 RepID=A0A8E2JAS8_9PEZI|nr:hypothetical protein K432DRAFT_397178 [Lepidopterella palustris CBS 459.81]